MCFCLKSIKKKVAAENCYQLPDSHQSKYELGPLLGNGGFGKVFQGTVKPSMKNIVFKVLHKRDVQVPREVLILERLYKHPNIISHIEHFYENQWFIVLERFGYMWNGASCDLFEMIDYFNLQRKHRLQSKHTAAQELCIPEEKVRYIISQLIAAIEFLRLNNLIHRDIKDENILVNENFEIKLADFGSATFLGVSNNHRSNQNDEAELNKFGGVFSQFLGTILYASPEVVQYNAYCGFMQESWSIGILAFTMLFGYSPFTNKDEILYRDLTLERLAPQMRDCITHDCKTVLLGCLNRNMLTRYSLNDLKTSGWVNYTPQLYLEPPLTWDEGPNCLYPNQPSDRYKSWSLVRRIGEPFQILYNTYARKEPKIESFVGRITRKDTKVSLAKS